jgi:hypothetical protein
MIIIMGFIVFLVVGKVTERQGFDSCREDYLRRSLQNKGKTSYVEVINLCPSLCPVA